VERSAVPGRTPRQIAASAAELQIIKLPIDLSATVSMAWHQRTAPDLVQLARDRRGEC